MKNLINFDDVNTKIISTGLFRNKYRVKSHRLQGWNYANTGHYFITIVTAFRKHVFGHIENDKMILNEIGKIAQNEFEKSFVMRSELSLGEFVFMPNHLHAIVCLDKSPCGDARPCRDARPCVSTNTPILYRQPKSISSFVAGFKSAAIQKINDWIDFGGVLRKYNRQNPLWQSNYHDHIIRNQREYTNIANYIVDNPAVLGKDRFNSLN